MQKYRGFIEILGDVCIAGMMMNQNHSKENRRLQSRQSLIGKAKVEAPRLGSVDYIWGD